MPFAEAPGGVLVHYADFDLHSEDLHEPVADPVVLIHGLGCDWRHWSRQIGWLAHSRHVIAPDVRGSGKTRWPAPGWTTAEMAGDVHAVVTGLGLRRPAIVGLSMGGTIALQYALDYPGDLGRLVVVDSLPGIPEEFAGVRDSQLDYIGTHSLREIAHERMAAAFTEHADPATKAWVVEMIASGDIDGYRSQARATLARFDVRGRLGEITVPATVIHGELDATVPSTAGVLIADGIKGAELRILQGQGHFAHIEAPGLFNPVLAQALGVPAGHGSGAVAER